MREKKSLFLTLDQLNNCDYSNISFILCAIFSVLLPSRLPNQLAHYSNSTWTNSIGCRSHGKDYFLPISFVQQQQHQSSPLQLRTWSFHTRLPSHGSRLSRNLNWKGHFINLGRKIEPSFWSVAFFTGWLKKIPGRYFDPLLRATGAKLLSSKSTFVQSNFFDRLSGFDI